MTSLTPTWPATTEDQRLYTEARLVEVSGQDCRVRVHGKRNAEHHTCVQWGTSTSGNCPVFVRLDAEPGGRPLHARCERSAASVDQAVRDGVLGIGADDGW